MKMITKSLLLGLAILGSFIGLLFLTASAASAADTRPGKDEHVVAAVRYAAYTSSTRETVHINVEKPAGESVLVEFLDGRGRVMAEQVLPKRNAGVYAVKFNVANLADGNYQVRITGRQTSALHQVTLTTENTPETVRLLSLNN